MCALVRNDMNPQEEKHLRVVFMGTPDISATCLNKILADGFDVVGVYTQIMDRFLTEEELEKF